DSDTLDAWGAYTGNPLSVTGGSSYTSIDLDLELMAAPDTGDTLDSGMAPTDTGLAPFDSGWEPSDTGLAPLDSGWEPPSDTGLAPLDTGWAPDDMDTGLAPLDSGWTAGGTGLAPLDSGWEPGGTGLAPMDSGWTLDSGFGDTSGHDPLDTSMPTDTGEPDVMDTGMDHNGTYIGTVVMTADTTDTGMYSVSDECEGTLSLTVNVDGDPQAWGYFDCEWAGSMGSYAGDLEMDYTLIDDGVKSGVDLTTTVEFYGITGPLEASWTSEDDIEGGWSFIETVGGYEMEFEATFVLTRSDDTGDPPLDSGVWDTSGGHVGTVDTSTPFVDGSYAGDFVMNVHTVDTGLASDTCEGRMRLNVGVAADPQATGSFRCDWTGSSFIASSGGDIESSATIINEGAIDGDQLTADVFFWGITSDSLEATYNEDGTITGSFTFIETFGGYELEFEATFELEMTDDTGGGAIDTGEEEVEIDTGPPPSGEWVGAYGGDFEMVVTLDAYSMSDTCEGTMILDIDVDGDPHASGDFECEWTGGTMIGSMGGDIESGDATVSDGNISGDELTAGVEFWGVSDELTATFVSDTELQGSFSFTETVSGMEMEFEATFTLTLGGGADTGEEEVDSGDGSSSVIDTSLAEAEGDYSGEYTGDIEMDVTISAYSMSDTCEGTMTLDVDLDDYPHASGTFECEWTGGTMIGSSAGDIESGGATISNGLVSGDELTADVEFWGLTNTMSGTFTSDTELEGSFTFTDTVSGMTMDFDATFSLSR
ncbi:MAG: hypothetical protein QGG40_05235, partial [Myxococcota bacterium]|nr:hypothetical protein [Myxococcota bacterium]